MQSAEFRMISFLEVIFGSKLGLGLQQAPAIVTEIMVPLRNGQGSEAKLYYLDHVVIMYRFIG